MPHQQDTGGFFVTVLEKVKPLPWAAPSKTPNTPVDGAEQQIVDLNTVNEKKRPKKRLKLGYKEDPFVFFNENEEVWSSIRYMNIIS